jgi:hypothetical protein
MQLTPTSKHPNDKPNVFASKSIQPVAESKSPHKHSHTRIFSTSNLRAFMVSHRVH